MLPRLPFRFLVDRLDNMKKLALGNGTKHCVLCGEKFGFLGASGMICADCKKVRAHVAPPRTTLILAALYRISIFLLQSMCTKCGIETTATKQKEPVWLCKICAETREMWKKSGAWFYKVSTFVQ
jgi:hypothetical protein